MLLSAFNNLVPDSLYVDCLPIRSECLCSGSNLRLQAKPWISYLMFWLVSTELYYLKNVGSESSTIVPAHRYSQTNRNCESIHDGNLLLSPVQCTNVDLSFK